MARQGVMQAYPINYKRFDKWPKPIITQPKLKGDRCRAIINSQGRATLLSSSEKEKVSIPHINEQLESKNLSDIELDGELYKHGMAHEDIRSIVSRTKYLHPQYPIMEYHIFDIINDNNQLDRVIAYDKLIKALALPNVVSLPWRLCYSLPVMERIYNEYLKDGYEGIILRNSQGFYKRKLSTDLMKFKPRVSGVYEVVGFTEEVSITGEGKNTLGALELMDEEGRYFSVGTGFTHKQRHDYWRQKFMHLGDLAKIKYQTLTKHGIPSEASFEKFIRRGVGSKVVSKI